MKQCNAVRLLLCALVMSVLTVGTPQVYAQDNTEQASGRLIMGQVLDEEGEPLPGATVRIKGSKGVGGTTTTTNDGTFSLRYTGSSKEPAISVSYIGMVTKDVPVNFKKSMKVILESDALKLSEVTVVDDGYNRLPRRDMVGAYTTIKAEDILMPGMESIDQMLQGRVAGMVVSNSSARVGSNTSIKIRGTSTILGNTDPLWVVDGVIQPDPIHLEASDMLTQDMATLVGNQVSWLNPLDIETITVLKDASATAIYGSKASNGVIVITTKKGSSERVAVRYQGNVSMRENKGYEHYNLMNSLERIQFSKEAYDAGARYQSTPLPQKYTYEGLMEMFNKRMITEEEFAYNMQRLETVNTDWFDLLTRNSISTSHNLSVSGGTEKITYNASFGYQKNSGTEKGNDNDMFTSRLNVGIRFNNRLRVDVNMGGSYRNQYGYYGGVNPQSYALSTSRALPCYDESGELAYYNQYYLYALNANQLQYGYNILNEMANTSSKSVNKTFSVSANIEFKICDWLNYLFVGSVQQSASNGESYAGENSAYIERNYRGYPVGSEEYGSAKYNAALLPVGGMLSTSSTGSSSYTMSHKLQFSNTFLEQHRVNLLAGFEMRSIENSSNSNTVWGYIPERGQMLVIPTSPGKLVPIGKPTPDWGVIDSFYRYGTGWKKYDRTDNYLSVFGVLAYSFRNAHVVNANFRWDASNRFGQDTNHKFNPTYSFGYSWRIAQENFIKDNVWWLNQMNLRVTYGIQGNVVNSVSPELIAAYGTGGIKNPYNQYYATISSIPNPYLKWESTNSWNFGLDLQLFSKVTMNLEYYTRSSNVILQQNIAQEYGMKKMRLNGGTIHNHGMEATLNFTPVSTKDFAWTVGFNASKNWSRTSSPEEVIQANEIQLSNYISGSSDRPLKDGYPLNSFWSFSFAGLDPETGYPLFNYLDYDETDNNIDPTTFLVYSGQRDPYFTGGFNTRVRYKDLSFGASFSALIGSKKRLPNPYTNFSNGKIPDPYVNLDKSLNDRWKQPGDEANTIIPALWTSTTGNFNVILPNGTSSSLYSMWANSDAMVVDGSFIRCNNINATYHLPQEWCQKFGAQSLDISASINNLFVIANKRWNGFDPELNNSVMPHMYTLGLSISF